MSTYIAAIEIGSSKITGAVGRVDDDHTLTILAIEDQQLTPGSVRYGCVMNVEEVSSKLNIVKRRLENNDKVSPRQIKGAYIAMGGRTLCSFPAKSSRAFGQETEITEAVIDELRRQVRNETSQGKEILDSVPVSYFIDGKKITNPVGNIGYEIRAVYNLIICDEKNKKNIHTAFQKIGLKIVGGIARILAVDSMILSRDQRGLGSVIIDFGAETTTVAVYKEHALRYLATIPMGSRMITKDLATILNISEERAEELKQNNINVAINTDDDSQTVLDKTIDNIDYKLINNIAKARISEIIANINYQIGQSHLKPEELTEGIILIGKGSRLNGFRDLLQKQTNMKIAYPSSNENIRFAPNLSVSVSEALDVLAILSAAAHSNRLTECLEMPTLEDTVVEKTPEVKPAKTEVTDKKEKSKEPGKKSWMNRVAGGFMEILRSEDTYDEDEE